MRPLAIDDDQVAFWQRHTRLGVALCVVLPAIVALHTVLSGSSPRAREILLLAAVVATVSPALLLVPVPRLVRHPRGRLFYDAWEAVGVLLATTFALLDGGADSPYVLVFFVLLAHAALAYPPVGMLIAGAGNLAGYLVVGLVGGGASAVDLLMASLVVAVATGTSAFASYNHVQAYRQVSEYARQVALLAERDGLTGCLNHRTFHERLRAGAAEATPEHPVSLLLIDVDQFKTVNDTHGHLVGDAVLQGVGSALLGLCSDDDAAGRIGGDEFALLLAGTGAARAKEVATELRQLLPAHGVHLATVSVGVASTGGADHTSLLSAADRAVYRAKSAGRDQVVVSGPVLRLPPQRPSRRQGWQNVDSPT